MFKTFTLLLILFFGAESIYCQDYDFGKVSISELEEKMHPTDSSAVASVLFEKKRSYFQYVQDKGFLLITEVQKRIKIYNEKGFAYGTEKVYLYKGDSDDENLSSLKGYTYNLVAGKINETKLNKSAVFNNDESRYWKSETFTFPNLKEGSIIEYKYNITSPFLSNIHEVQVQREIPVDQVEASFEFPEYFYFKPLIKGYYPLNIATSAKSGSINFVNKNRSNNNGHVVKTTYSSQKLDYKININSINLSNIPALKDEPFVNNIDNYRASIDYELSYIKFPNAPIEYYATTWEDVTKKIYGYSDFGNELRKTGYFEKDIDPLMANASTNEEKVGLIFNYVKNKMAWNQNHGYTCHDGVKEAYKKNSGNIAEINLMLTSMLNYAGVEAYPVLVSTRSHGVPLFPTQEGFNYVITAAKLGDGYVLMDATSKYSIPGMLPTRALNWYGRIIRKDGNSMQIDLMPRSTSREVVNMLVDIDVQGGAKGKVRGQYFDYNALSYRINYDQKDENDIIKDRYNEIVIDEYEIKNKKDLQKPIIEQFSFYDESAYDLIADKIYLSPLFFFAMKENPFKLEKREFPIDFSYPREESYMININVPEGYKVESLPDPMKMVIPDGMGEFSYMVVQNQQILQLKVDLKISSAVISPLYYDAIKQYFSKIIEKEKEKIVISQL
ncbi:DUF3857 domain-containing protein [Galbibacter sp. PAP.153]|uniref:DUF3857 domain-containing protein n=1 Tax=Galbibacter sp. PAP.153 TaxID=3104623 RepID=UPI003008E73E